MLLLLTSYCRSTAELTSIIGCHWTTLELHPAGELAIGLEYFDVCINDKCL